MTSSPPIAPPRRPLAPRLVVSFIAAMSLLLGPLAFAPANAATTFSVSGTVSGEGAGLLEDVSVELQKYDTQDEYFQTDDYADTDENGAYSFADVDAGATYRVLVRSHNSFAGFTSAAFVLNADKTVPAITLALGGSLSGTVKEAATNALIENAAVEAFPWDGTKIDFNGGVYANVDTDDGSFTLDGLAAGDYKVQITDNGGNHVTEFYDNASDVAGAKTVKIVKGSDSPLGDITLDVGASFSGTLVDDDGDPVEDPSVSALRMVNGVPDYENAYSGQVDEDGHYTIPALPAGSYKISLSENSYAYFDQFYNNKSTVETADAQTIDLGDNEELGTTTLEKTASATGKVMKSATVPFGDALVEAFRVVGGGLATDSAAYAYTESDGTFTFMMSPLHAGTYRLVYHDGLHNYLDQTGPAFTVTGGDTFAAGTTVMVKKPVKVVKKAATVKVSGKGGKKKATLTISVKASGVTPTGKVTIKLGSKTLKTVTLKKGKATAKLTKQKKGKRTYKVIYSGDSKVLGKTVNSKKITIK